MVAKSMNSQSWFFLFILLSVTNQNQIVNLMPHKGILTEKSFFGPFLSLLFPPFLHNALGIRKFHSPQEQRTKKLTNNMCPHRLFVFILAFSDQFSWGIFLSSYFVKFPDFHVSSFSLIFFLALPSLFKEKHSLFAKL